MATVSEPLQTTAGYREPFARRVVRFLGKAPVNILLALIALLWLLPTLGLLITSLLPADEFNSHGWWAVFSDPSKLTWQNYSALFDNSAITSSLVTTIEIAIGGTVLPVLVASLAGYAFAWLEFPGRDWLFIAVIGLLVVPLQMALIPMFRIYNNVGIFDTVLSLVLFHTAFALPFAIFLLRNFFAGIPKDIVESARIDGSSEWRIFTRLMLPLGLPAIASLAIFQFLWTWNDLLVGLTFGRSTQPITVAIFSQMRQFGSNIDIIAPAAFLALAVPLLVFFAFQRYFVQGLLAGSVK
jgi:alpha-glucoside transport system permease protein